MPWSLRHGGPVRKTVEPMSQRQNRMAPEHSWPGVAHHLFDLFAPFLLITMNGAFGAGGFIHAKAATFQSFGGIGEQLGALAAKRTARRVMGTAVTSNH
jgi:hypothetical protein